VPGLREAPVLNGTRGNGHLVGPPIRSSKNIALPGSPRPA
jgi:hypothetical protein